MTYWDQYGGKDAYITSQQQRYMDAYKTNNADLINRLKADAQRVGYSLPAINQPKPAQQPAQSIQPTQSNFSYQPQMTNEVQGLLQQIQNYVNKPQMTPEQVMQGEMYQGLKGAVDQQAAERMRNVKAQLAASGVLGEGSTPAVERMGEVEQQTTQQLGSLLPQLMQQAQYQRQSGLNELLSGLGAHSGAETDALNRALGVYGAVMPYTHLTEYQRQSMPLQWGQTMGEVQGDSSKQYVSGNTVTDIRPFDQSLAPGAQVQCDQSRPEVAIINGKPVHGTLVNGKLQVPVWAIMEALGMGG